MPWMMEKRHFDGAKRLRERLSQPGIIKAPGAHDALTGRLAARIGFECLYISGAAFSASRAMPDLGFFTLTELASYVLNLYRATDLPIIVDIDTGFGEPMHLPRTIFEMEDAGAAAVQIEDQKMPKKCGHVEGKELISGDDMCRKIESIRKVRKDILIIARTDALAINGFQDAVNRAKQFANAGADVIFPEALTTEEEFRTMATEVKIPLLANMTEFGKTPYIPAAKFQEWGYKIVIYPVSTLRVAMKAAEKLLTAIYETGSQEALLDEMQTRKELYELLDYHGYTEYDQSLADLKFN